MSAITSVNWSDLQKAAGEAGFDPVPAGDYDAIVKTASVKTAASGKSMIAAQLAIVGGPYDGKNVFSQFVLSPENQNALAFFFRHMAALGLGEAYFKSNPQLERVAADLVNRPCRLRVSQREWQGTLRNQVDGIMPPSGANGAMPGPVPSPAAPVTAAPAVPPATAPRPPAPAVPPTPPVPATQPAAAPPPSPPAGDDDLPF